MAVRAIIFDMDGLMIDTETLYWAAGREVARRYGKVVADETLGRMMGRSPVDSMRVFAAETEIDRDPAELLQERDAMVFAKMQAGVQPMPGLFEILPQLKQKFLLAICTSARPPFVKVAVENLGISQFFDAVQTSDGVLNGKPAPEIYLKAMAQLSVQPEESVVLEDSSNGSLAGKRAGAYVIAVPSEHTRGQDFSFVDEVAEGLLDAAARIERLTRL
jgi:HAD superfamily hydrolase (TIGR01509 family)